MERRNHTRRRGAGPAAALALLLLAFAGGWARAQETAEPVISTLDNGLTAALIENHQSPVVALRVYVRAGAMYEGEYLGAGLSHFLEHLVSGGSTTRRTEAEGKVLLDSIGAQMNAYTTRDHTCYYITTASRFFDPALDLLSDWVMNAAIKPEEWQREFEVIQREMESRRSEPDTVLTETMDRTMFRVSPARVPVLGYREAFRAMTRDDVYKYYRRTYVPDNVLFVASGDFDAQKTMEKVRAAFSKFERRPAAAPVLPAEPRQIARRIAVREMPASESYLMTAWRTIPLNHPDLHALDLLSFILGNGESSRLVRKLREEQKLVTNVTAWSYTPGYDGGQFAVYANLDPARLAAAQEAILAEVRRVREELVSDEELQRAKRQKVAEHVFGRQTAEEQASEVAQDILFAYDPRFSRQYVQRIQEVTAAEVRDVAQRYLGDEKLCVAIVKPPTAAAQAQPGAAAPVLEETVKTTLPNGLRVLIRRIPAQPIVAIQAYFLGGVRIEPPGKNGLAAFTARMLPRGTATRSAEEIARAFDRMGGSLSAAAGNNSTYLSAACLSEDLPRAMEIVADVLRAPAFKPEEIERLRPQLLAVAEQQRDDWREELAWNFRKAFFKTHPYRNTPEGTPAEIKGIAAEDIQAFYKRSFAPLNCVLAVFGDVQPDQVRALLDKHFLTWSGSSQLELPVPAPEPVAAEDRTVPVKGAQKMGGVFIGYPGLVIKDEKDRYALDVFDALVSGAHIPRGWLHDALRGKGLVYEVHAYNVPGIEPGYFAAYAGCEPARVEEVKKVMLEQLTRIFREKVSDADLDAAKRICLTAEVLERQTDAQQATRAALDELYGLGHDAGKRYGIGINGVTEEEMRRVVKKYLTKYTCVVMTPP